MQWSEVAIRRSTFETMDLDDMLFVTIGPPLDGLRRAMVAQRPPPDGGNNPQFNNNLRRSNEGNVARIRGTDDLIGPAVIRLTSW